MVRKKKTKKEKREALRSAAKRSPFSSSLSSCACVCVRAQHAYILRRISRTQSGANFSKKRTSSLSFFIFLVVVAVLINFVRKKGKRTNNT